MRLGLASRLCAIAPPFLPGGLEAASLFEINIPIERQPVLPDGPKISAELADLADREARAKANTEVELMKKALGWTK
jgi:hypothetical protein